ncbi:MULTISPECIES: hypothetical protein [Enterobacteriaceae]|uniref:Uncharacterized protein n=1 Tax=Citrobacter braakii TaxID=57706 RepID=A0A8I0GA76_CITBR|nr:MULTISPECIES: hypothetical protein [Enterobacteriaceae]MBD3126143.1 hypothetical protein [Citrobacter braakii]MDM2754897.1 hypothetical protein [Citrobacter sp. Cpo221]PPS48322.1 hypothetical protein BWR12_23830 [Citrobacter braakii]
MNDNELNTVPATVLKVMAAQVDRAGGPVPIRSNDDRAALAAVALWQFARLTGLDDDGESLDTVLTDFLGDMLHLCEQCGTSGAGEARFNAALRIAKMHFEQESGEDDGDISW